MCEMQYALNRLHMHIMFDGRMTINSTPINQLYLILKNVRNRRPKSTY